MSLPLPELTSDQPKTLRGWKFGQKVERRLWFRARYERGSIILTSNKGFAEWRELLRDPVIATPILDRLLHHSHVLNIRGDS